MAAIRRWLRLFLLSGLILFILGVLALVGLYAMVSPHLPDVQELRTIAMQEPLSVYSRDGKLIALFGETRRYPVKIDAVPERVKQAVISIEDASFYEHQGLDIKGISRAVWLLLTTDKERVPGGSTITQQVAKNFYLSSEYSYSRKFKEMLLALKMERELSKDEILELYLNKIFFGNRAYGIAAAAEFYYGKKLDQLTLDEAAALAGTPKFPSSANPLSNVARSTQRRDYVLQRMRELGHISRAEEEAARAQPMHAARHEPELGLYAPYLAEMVRQAMVERYGEAAETAGYRVTTTVLSKDQLAADQAVREGLAEYSQRRGYKGPEGQIPVQAGDTDASLVAKMQTFAPIHGMPVGVVLEASGSNATVLTRGGLRLTLDGESTKWTGRNAGSLFKRGDVVRLLALPENKFRVSVLPDAEAALISVQPEDGAVRAVVGGLSFARSKFNRVTQAKRQPGSSFKPFLYSAAFERGYTPASIVLDAPVVFRDRVGHVWRPQNDNGTFAGPMRMREALVQSRNLVSVRLLDAIGVDFARQYIAQFGFKIDELPPNLSMSLGTASLTPLSIAKGYAVMANGGFRVDPYFIERVADRHGATIDVANPPRACRYCAQRMTQESRAGVIVDGFDFSPNAPKAAAPADGEPAAAPVPTQELLPGQTLAPRAIDERTSFLIKSLMRDVVKRGTATAAKVLNREDIGGKTGSTNEHRDAWFSGFGGDVVTTVWVGKDDFKSLGYREYGGKAALPIWINFMRAALDGVPDVVEGPPPGVVTVAISPGSGNILPEGTPGSIKDYMRQEDYDRLQASGFMDNFGEASEESYDIF
jgi:penicillin-binding protein 1A